MTINHKKGRPFVNTSNTTGYTRVHVLGVLAALFCSAVFDGIFRQCPPSICP